MATITMFAKPWCPDCQKASETLYRAQLPFIYQAVNNDERLEEAALELARSIEGRDAELRVPVIKIEDSKLGDNPVILIEPNGTELGEVLAKLL